MTRLADLTWGAAQEMVTRSALLLVPLGSTEQHGPHLPLSTDTDIATAIAERASRRLTRALVAPAIAYGSSGEHDGFPGTLSIGQRAIELVVIELVRSASARFGYTVLVSAHGGNHEPVGRACRRLRSEGHEVLLFCPRWKGDAHAGRIETSVMLALDPARVALGRAAAGNATPLGSLIAALRSGGVRSVSPNGVLGDPAHASAEEGERLLETSADDLCRRVTEWLGRTR
jgi:mycofactocin system creatininase family protein